MVSAKYLNFESCWVDIIMAKVVKKKGQKSKEKIMETTLKLIFQKGYNETSAQEVADICGISQATIFYHFKTKQKLFLEILYYVIQNNRSIFEAMHTQDLGPVARLKSLLLANIKWALNYPEQTNMVLLLFNFATFDIELREVADQTIKRGQEMVFDILNEMSPDKEKNLLQAKLIQQYANGVMFQILASNRPQDVATNFEKSVDGFLAGIL